MRKIGAILLIFCMAMSLVSVPAFAEGEIVIDATSDVKDFYDNGMNGGNGSLEIFKENLMLRQCGEWVSYDVSELAAGTYSVDVSYKSTAGVIWKTVGLDFAVDGSLEVRSYLAQTGTSWDDAPAAASAGKIYVPEGAKELKVKNHGMYPVNLDTITLTYIGADDTTEDIVIYAQNATSSPNAAKTAAEHYLGVDYWDAATGTASNYTKEDADGNLHLPFTSGSILETTKLVQHAADWARYDISDFKAGTYEVTLNRAHKVDAAYSLKIDGKTALSAELTKTADAYGTYADVVMGKIYISESSEYLTLLNEGSGSVYVDYMKFTYISEERAEETIPSVTIAASNVISGGQGVGFYANTMNNGSESLETSGANVVLRQAGEWAAYDVSSLEAGVYALNLSYTVREDIGFYLDVYVDDVLQAKTKPAKTTNTLGGTPDTNTICSIEITKDSKVLKIRNSSRCVTFIQSIGLEYSAAASDSYVIRQYGDHATLHDESNTMVYESGVDFYDAGGKAFTSCLENGILAQNAGDWARYDISGLKQGTYKVTLNYASIAAAQMKFKVDGNLVLMNDMPATGTAYGNYADGAVGNVYIEEGSQYLILENLGAGSVYPKYFELERISEDQTSWPRIAFKGSKVISGGQDVGYYDTSGSGTLELSGTSVILRADEWVKYDVSELKPGTYSLTLYNSSTASCMIKADVDDSVQLISPTFATEAYSTFEENYLGSVYIGENTETITIKNTGASNTYIGEVIFDNMSDADEAVMQLTVSASDVLKDEGETVEGVSYYDAGGEGKFETSGGAVVLRQGDWVRYDLSSFGLDAGIYTVYATLQSNAATALGVEAEGTGKLRSTAITGATSTDSEVEIGKLILGEASTYFTVSIDHTQRVMLYSLKITDAVYEETTVKYSSDAEGTAAVTSLSGLESAYVTVSMIRPETAAIGETVYIALYEGNRLESVQMIPVTDDFEYTNTFAVTGLDAESSIKTFVWDSANDAPVAGETEISAQ